MNTPAKIAIAVGAVALTAISVWGACGLTKHVIIAIDHWGAAQPANTLAKMDATLDAINAPCKDFQGNYTCGPIVQLSQTEKNVGILAARSAQQVQQTGVLVTAVANNLNTVGEAVKDTASHLNKTADAGTGTLNAATDTLGEGKRTIAAAQPLLETYMQSGHDLDAILKDQAIHQTLINIQSITASSAGIMVDGKKITDKATADYLSPQPWWRKIGRFAGDTYDYGALFARHTP